MAVKLVHYSSITIFQFVLRHDIFHMRRFCSFQIYFSFLCIYMNWAKEWIIWIVVRKKASWHTDKPNDKLHFSNGRVCLFVCVCMTLRADCFGFSHRTPYSRSGMLPFSKCSLYLERARFKIQKNILRFFCRILFKQPYGSSLCIVFVCMCMCCTRGVAFLIHKLSSELSRNYQHQTSLIEWEALNE